MICQNDDTSDLSKKDFRYVNLPSDSQNKTDPQSEYSAADYLQRSSCSIWLMLRDQQRYFEFLSNIRFYVKNLKKF